MEQSTDLNSKILLKEGDNPEKVINEGDTPQLNTNIHSFYWSNDGPKKQDDYEPIAISSNPQYCMSRVHYRGLVVWKNYISINEKPIASFLPGYHTPLICTDQTVSSPLSSNDKDRAFQWFFLQYLKGKKLDQSIKKRLNQKYKTSTYPLINESIPEQYRFKLEDFTYYVLVAPDVNLESLGLPQKLIDKLIEIKKTCKKD